MPLQYEIGNPLTAASMTRHDLAAVLYGQFGDERVTEVSRKLDRHLETALLQAAS